jgi:hypothetical protein
MNSSIDAAKLVSSMTLFGAVAQRLHDSDRLDHYASIAHTAEEILTRAERERHPRCPFTLDRLRAR